MPLILSSPCCRSVGAGQQTNRNTWTTQMGRSFCLFGKSRIFAVGGVSCFPGSVFKFCAKERRQQEIGGIRREIGGMLRKQVLACRSVCCVSAFCLMFGGNFCRRINLRQKVLPPEGPGIRNKAKPGRSRSCNHNSGQQLARRFSQPSQFRGTYPIAL